jgi:hypothetical protein
LLNIGCEDQLPPYCPEEHFQLTTKQLPTHVSLYTHIFPHVLRLHTTPCILCNSSSIFDVNTIHFSMSTIWAGKISGILGVLGPGGGLKSSIDSVPGPHYHLPPPTLCQRLHPLDKSYPTHQHLFYKVNNWIYIQFLINCFELFTVSCNMPYSHVLAFVLFYTAYCQI